MHKRTTIVLFVVAASGLRCAANPREGRVLDSVLRTALTDRITLGQLADQPDSRVCHLPAEDSLPGAKCGDGLASGSTHFGRLSEATNLVRMRLHSRPSPEWLRAAAILELHWQS